MYFYQVDGFINSIIPLILASAKLRSKGSAIAIAFQSVRLSACYARELRVNTGLLAGSFHNTR